METKTYTLNEKATNFNELEAEMIADLTTALTGASIAVLNFGAGTVVGLSGNTIDNLCISVDFDNIVKTFLATAILLNLKTATFEDFDNLQLFKAIHDEHTRLISERSAIEASCRADAKAEAKKADRIKKAEANYEKQKEKAIRDFEEMPVTSRTKLSQPNEFFYSLGWLAAHVGTIKAAMPDYLESAFVNRFGADALRKIVDSTKRTVNGYPVQWAMSFTASLPKDVEVPATLTQYLSSTGKGIANTAFIWDLVYNYGFKFSKKQDVVNILSYVPDKYVPIFNEGYNAN